MQPVPAARQYGAGGPGARRLLCRRSAAARSACSCLAPGRLHQRQRGSSHPETSPRCTHPQLITAEVLPRSPARCF